MSLRTRRGPTWREHPDAERRQHWTSALAELDALDD